MHLKITPQRTAGPLSRQCQRCRRQSAAVRAVFPLYFHLREQLADTLYHKGRQQFRPPTHRRRTRTRSVSPLAGPGRHRYSAAHCSAGRTWRRTARFPAAAKLTLLFVQYTAALLHRGQHMVIGAQQEKMPHCMAVISRQGLTFTWSSAAGMVATAYWLSVSRSSRANSSPSTSVSPKSATN